MPLIVTASSAVLGTWFLDAVAPVVYGGSLAIWGAVIITVRTVAGVSALSAGSFALAAGLERRWLRSVQTSQTMRHARGLVALGGFSMATGAFTMFGRLLGFESAGSIAVAGVGAVLALFSAWSLASLRRANGRAEREPAQRLGTAPLAPREWLAQDLARAKTPVT